MTTAKQPATRYDAEIADIMASQKQGSTDFWKLYSLRNQCEGWLRHALRALTGEEVKPGPRR